MNTFITIAIAVLLITGSAIGALAWQKHSVRYSDAEFGAFDPDDAPPRSYEELYANWTRPAGPLRVGLQIGHWKNSELPEELERLIGNTGAKGGGTTEVAVNTAIAEATAELLTSRGVEVDIIPATVPVDYWADLFIAIHADGSPDPWTSGFKVATPRRDLTGSGPELEHIFLEEYGAATGLAIDPNVTRNMRGYYAFNWRRHDHAIHPMTPAIILETGFLTSPVDQRILISNPQRAADGIANAVISFLDSTRTKSD